MNSKDLKVKMMKLWKDTFHDSDAYISLVFENYYDPEFIEYYEENGRLVSALIGIPYYFSNGKEKIKGLYLCGLATLEEYRHRGIMTGLIEKICKKAEAKGFSISFLIPASDILRIYYASRGFCNAMYVVEDRYTDVHNFENDYMQILNKEDDRIRVLKTKYFENLKVEILDINDKYRIEKTIEYITESEKNISTYVSLIHSSKDANAIIQENAISGGKILISTNVDNKITGALFITFDERKRIIIPKIYHEDNCTYFKLLDRAKRMYPELSMSVFCYPEETERRVLWSKVYGAGSSNGNIAEGSYGVAERVYEVNRHARPYGMAKILNIRQILEFIARDRNDCKFSILIKNPDSGSEYIKCTIDSGSVKYNNVSTDEACQIRSSRDITELSLRDLSEILFRKKDSNNLIMEALGIPRMALNMSLLLD